MSVLKNSSLLLALALTAGLAAQTPTAVSSTAATPAPNAKKSKTNAKKGKAAPAAATVTPTAALTSDLQPPPGTTVVEKVVARVNDKYITSTDLANAEAALETQLQEDAKQPGAPPLTAEEIARQKKDLLSNLIDNQLLVQRAADLGMSAETESVLQLDQLRQQNHLASMEDLQKAIEAQGMSYEDYQQQIKNQILQRKVIEEDVAPRVAQATPQQIADYYNAHKAQFVRGDEVGLSEILIRTDNKPASEKDRLKSLADQVQQRAAAGEDFAKLAQRYSNAESAATGGDIGFQKKNQLETKLADALFALPVGGVSPVEEVPNGYLILKVTAIHHAGQESLADAKAEIDYQLYEQAMRPELTTYLAKLRSDAFITVKPGYVDTGAALDNSATDITRFQRVLPSDLPKPTDKDKKGGLNVGGGAE
ncbi:MAG TPA: peptidyl-prolyl cis-trans isomerase [Terriglobales bacterium]|nr:peptidyl-prolyl cis-trans isomerase [Terriglobales bacterium]